MSNTKARSPSCTLALFVVAALLTLKPSDAYSFSPFITYHLCMMNELPRETLSLKCWQAENGANKKHLDSKSDDPSPIVMSIPAHNSYNWSFHPNLLWGDLSYYCSAEWARNGRRFRLSLFKAFLDRPSFVDDLCGGRHCIWKFAMEGVYLYYIPSRKFMFMYDWPPVLL